MTDLSFWALGTSVLEWIHIEMYCTGEEPNDPEITLSGNFLFLYSCTHFSPNWSNVHRVVCFKGAITVSSKNCCWGLSQQGLYRASRWNFHRDRLVAEGQPFTWSALNSNWILFCTQEAHKMPCILLALAVSYHFTVWFMISCISSCHVGVVPNAVKHQRIHG